MWSILKKGRKYHDGSTPLRFLQSIISAYSDRDMKDIQSVRAQRNAGERSYLDSDLPYFNSLQIFRAPPLLDGVKERDLWVIYTKDPETSRLDDGHFFVFWKGSWMYCGSIGRPDAALKWHSHIEDIKKVLWMPWNNSKK